MTDTLFQRIRIVLFIAVFWRAVTAVMTPAQELGYSGVGAVNHSFAGATASLPLDGNGAMYWNPATIGDLEYGEIQLGFGRTAAPWFGDESLVAGVLVSAGAVLWLYAAANSNETQDDFEWWDRRAKKENRDSFDWKKEHPLSYPKVRGLNFSFVMPPQNNRRWHFGFAAAETGSRKIHFVADSESGQNTLWGHLYRVKTIELTPTVSYRLSKRFQFGFSPVLSITEFPGTSFPILPGYEWNGETEHTGFGFQLGAYYRTKNNFNFGFSVRSPHWMTPQNIQWINGSGDLVEQKLRYSTEYPMRYVFGISYTGFEMFKLAFDVRLYDFQHLSSFYGVTGHSVPNRAVSYAAGIQFSPRGEMPFIFRLGYQFNDSPVNWDNYYFNSTPPIAYGHSIHYGMSIGKPEEAGFEISFSLSHSFGSRGPKLQTTSETQSFKRHPNNNAFWWNVRYKF